MYNIYQICNDNTLAFLVLVIGIVIIAVIFTKAWQDREYNRQKRQNNSTNVSLDGLGLSHDGEIKINNQLGSTAIDEEKKSGMKEIISFIGKLLLTIILAIISALAVSNPMIAINYNALCSSIIIPIQPPLATETPFATFTLSPTLAEIATTPLTVIDIPTTTDTPTFTATTTYTSTFTATTIYTPTSTYTSTFTATTTYTPTFTPNQTFTPTESACTTDTSRNTSNSTTELGAAIEQAWNFVGTSNRDWQPFIHEFDDGVKMVLVPVGRFMMGSEIGKYDERPVEQYCITTPFWIDLTEVTQYDFERLSDVRANSSFHRESNNLPVEEINLSDAQTYCEQQGKRLPTEAEWEYAARGVESWRYPWGNEFDGDRLNYCDKNCSESWHDTVIDDGYRYTAPAGSFPDGVSWVGTLDMSGNVAEWTSSLYIDYPYNSSDGREDNADNRPNVARGGSWYSDGLSVTSSFRSPFESNAFSDQIGFRCVRDIDN